MTDSELIASMGSIIRDVEWVEDCDGQECCPVCQAPWFQTIGAMKDPVHATDCSLAAAIVELDLREAAAEKLVEAVSAGSVENVIKANAEAAIDQRASYPSLEGALDSHWENVLDTLFLGGAARDKAFVQYRDAVRATASRLSVSLEGTVYAMEKAR